ncbi:hypothetical protein Cni_G19809 [Canna indica]|uniref:Uncharacterized protein n=1 Tax=Canna indica TaxID=4628 RepID=A0AAQ3KQ65_9LILI|nr:hypothetical protein Cni_G19809 [Canna indica]
MSSVAATGGGSAGAAKIRTSLPVKAEGGGAKGKGVAVPEVKKKVDASGKVVSVVKQNSTTVVANSQGKTTANSAKTVTKTKGRTRAEKKVYALPGQKFDVPEEREPLRIFYESLSKQIPSSEMAEVWMMEHGLLSPERAKKALDRKLKRNNLQRLGGPDPVKSYKQERPESSRRPQDPKNGDVKAKKRPFYEDDDFIVKTKRTK